MFVGPQFDAPPLSVTQRAFDIGITLLVLPFALVIGALIALAVALDSAGPVLYRQVRVGQGGRRFVMLKFRKMHRAAEGELVTRAGDERFTPIGAFLTLTKLDELPQLWNVLKGDMRLVGPRPEVEAFVSEFSAQYRLILTAVPGITGPAAVAYANEGALLVGLADSHAFYRSTILPQKLQIDMEYVRTRTARGDLALLLATAVTPAIRLARRGVGLRGLRERQARLNLAWGMVGTALVLTFAVTSMLPG